MCKAQFPREFLFLFLAKGDLTFKGLVTHAVFVAVSNAIFNAPELALNNAK